MTTVIVDVDQFSDDSVDLAADSFHHLFRVRRLRVGDVVRVVDGDGRARRGEVAVIERHSASLALGDPIPGNEPSLRVELLVASPRPQRAAWLVEKATEIGVYAVRFLRSQRSPRTYGPSTVKRLCRSARAAVEQCDRSRVPEVTASHEPDEIPAIVGRFDRCFVLDPRAANRGSEAQLALAEAGAASLGLLVGPEGGWDESELELFSSLGCVSVGLGRRTLRVETAAVVGAAAFLVTPSVDTL